MLAIIRDSAVGTILRFLSNKRVASYPEDDRHFQPPDDLVKQDDNISELSIVTWYGKDDPENPRNWSTAKKLWVSFVLLLYTFSAYIGSSLYVAGASGVSETFHVSRIASSAGLAIYVIGYGIGPLLFSPLSEIAKIGRNSLYIVTLIIFVILTIPAALVSNFAGLLVLRFFLGFFASPALATVGASYGDFWDAERMPYIIAFWGGGAALAPAMGPFLAGFAVQSENWRWSTWELLWLSVLALFFVIISLPETSEDCLLLRRAERLREATGLQNLRSESEVKQSRIRPRDVVFFALIKPCQINALDPAVLFNTVYTALTYGIYYSFFESFDIVYRETYGFNLGEFGLTFLSLMLGVALSAAAYAAYFYFSANPRMAKIGFDNIPPEERLRPGLYGTFFLPAGLFLFGEWIHYLGELIGNVLVTSCAAWTSQEHVHWIFSAMGVTLSMVGVFIITQCMLLYLPFTYPTYSGSLFAANAFARSAFAAGAVLFSQPMFDSLGVQGGVSLLAGLTTLCVGGIFYIYFYGANIRKRSRFAIS